jgi:hypothetical protein
VKLPFVDGVLTAEEVRITAATIAEWQLPSGMLPWFPGGHADPWNHVEAAMALATCGFTDEAEHAYRWLADIQRPDGSWHNYYTGQGIEDAKLDSNCIAYVATGVWHQWLTTADRGFLEAYWPVVDKAIEFVLDLQTKRGEIVWARHADGMPWSYALLTGSSSISHSLGCAVLIAQELGQDRPHWDQDRNRLVSVIANQPDAFEPKERWAMDWYYPVLTGAVIGDAATKMMAAKHDDFIMADKGVRCVSDRPWVTAAETCECVMAYAAAGEWELALQLFIWAQTLRDPDGRYFTGLVYPELVHFPDAERSTYTAAAVVLAADCLYGENPTSKLFSDHC